MSSPAHSANPAGATHDAVLLGFFRPPRRSLFVMHLPGREPHREPHTLTFFSIATSSNAPSEGNPRSPHREGLKADPSTKFIGQQDISQTLNSNFGVSDLLAIGLDELWIVSSGV